MNMPKALGFLTLAITVSLLSSCETVNVAGPITLDCDNQSGVIRLTNDPEEAVDYLINCTLTIGENDELIIEPGTVIEMASGAHIRVETLGKIKAVGTEAEPIIIRGQQALAEYWRGIVIESDFEDNSLQYVQMSDGGDWWNITAWGLLQLWGSGAIAIDHCTISNTKDGMNVFRSMELASFTHNTIQNCDEQPMNLDIMHLESINLNNTFTGNGQNYLNARGGVLSASQTWTANQVPIYLSGALVDENISLTIEKGVSLLMSDDQFVVDGSLKIRGSDTEPVTINGQVEDAPGYWEGIAFNTFDVDNVIDHAIISGGGSYDNFSSGNIILYAGELSVTNSTIKNSATCGIRLSGNTATISDNTYDNNTEGDVCP